MRHAAAENDPLWRLPLWRPYESMLEFESRRHQQCRRRPGRRDYRARCSCAASSTAKSWLHFDIFAWTPSAKPGRPEGGECQAARGALRAARCALRLTRRDAPPSILASRRRAPISRPNISKARSTAARFVEGTRHAKWSSRKRRCAASRGPTRRSTPKRSRASASRSTTTNGEGWAWGQLAADGYVGWLPANALGAAGRGADPQGRGAAHAWSFPGRRSNCRRSRRCRSAQRSRSRASRSAWRSRRAALMCRRAHLKPIGEYEADFVAVAERFLGVPYLWGGKTALGLDCSGLVQVALTACGVACPRDSDMQEAALGAPLCRAIRRSAARRSDVLEGPRRHRARRSDA